MKWENLRRLDADLVEIGSHGHSHRNMASLIDEELKVEIMKSKEILESELHAKVDSFAYPYGELFRFDEGRQNIKGIGLSLCFYDAFWAILFFQQSI